MSSSKIIPAAICLAALFTGIAAAAGPDYAESISIAKQIGQNPSGWVAPTGSLISISGNSATDAAYGIKYDSGSIIVRTATKASYYSGKYAGKADTIYGNPTLEAAWVTTGDDATKFLQNNGATGDTATTLLERGLGMNNNGTHDMVLEMAVAPTADNIMRPIKNADISTYSALAADYGDSASFVQPTGMSTTAYANFQAYYANWKTSALDNNTFPWTQMGYTYFWGNGYTQSQTQGMTEFILPGGTGVTLYGLYATQSYIYTLNDGSAFSTAATAQYGNGFASFNVDGGCDTIWAGHRFQKNVKTATANEIIVTTSGVVSGGSGILVWSLNYELTNLGTITGATANKFSVAGTSNIGVLFKGDTSTTYGTPLAGINKFTNSGSLSSPGIALKAEAGDTTVINNAGGSISGGTYAVLTGAGNDTLTVHGGNISGSVDLGGGTNILTVDGAATVHSSLDRTSAATAQINNITTANITDNTLTLAPSVTGTANIRHNDSFLILDATALTADASKITALADTNRPMLTFTAVKTGNQLLLQTARDNTYYARLAAPGVGGALDSLANTASGDMANLIGTLDASGNPADALKLAPQPDNGAIASVEASRRIITDEVMNHLAASTAAARSGEITAWGQGFASYLHQNARGSAPGFLADIGGAAAGFDLRISPDIIAGAGFGYAADAVRSRDNSGWTDAKTYQAQLYGTITGDKGYLSAMALFGQTKYTAMRYINFSTVNLAAASDYSGQQYGLYAEGGRTLRHERLAITPVASLQYAYLHTRPYTETGAGAANLSVDSQNYGSLQSGLGFKLTYELPRLTPGLHAKWLYTVSGGDMEAEAAFAGGGAAFKTTGYSQPRSSALIGADCTLKLGRAVTAVLSYDTELKTDYYSHNGFANIRYLF